jgi:Methyltransferase domain
MCGLEAPVGVLLTKVTHMNSMIPCRLCGSESAMKFQLRGFNRLNTVYFECTNCGSLQTQEPSWLQEAYTNSNLSITDTGAAQRVLVNHAWVLMFARFFQLRRMLDFGGGDGLLCRLLRNRGLDAYTTDDHVKSTYAPSFEGTLTRGYDLITAFEVFEHLPHPSSSLQRLFEVEPRFIVGSTEIYSGQDSSWWYLSPHTGQHVFFYSPKALELLARRYRYSYYAINGVHVFAREPISRFRLSAIARLTSGKLFQLFRATLPFFETWEWILRDYEGTCKGLRINDESGRQNDRARI